MRYLKSIYEFVVPMGIGFDKWKDMQKDGMTAKKYHEDHPVKKFKIVHGHKEGEIGKPLPGATNLSYTKASKQHKAIVMNEKLGVPDEIDPWISLLYGFIKHQIYIFVDKTSKSDEYDINTELDGEEFTSKSIVFSVKNDEFDKYIKKYIPSDNRMKVKSLQIYLTLSTVPDDLVSFDNWSASFNDSTATIKDGIYTNVELNFDITLPDSLVELTTNEEIDKLLRKLNIEKEIIGFLSHEITHMYEWYNRGLKNINTWKDRLLNTNKYVTEKQKLSNISSDWDKFLRKIYLSLDFEINARVSQLYYQLSETTPRTKQGFIDQVKRSTVWKEMLEIKEFDGDKFYDDFEYNATDEDLRSAFKELDVYTDEELETSDMKYLLLKELISIWNKSIIETNKLHKGSGEMEKVSSFYLNNPKGFIKFFENRFHSKAKVWERKIFRLSSRFNLRD